MVRGFYTLGSGMLTQGRVLNTISNNFANENTAGFKKSSVMEKTFGNMLIRRMDKGCTSLGDAALLDIADESITNFSQGAVENTGRNLDFGIFGDGFFAVQGSNGQQTYTRSGSFNIDDQGYLVLKGKGRVMGTNGPIHVGTENITADEQGNLYVGTNRVGQIALYDFRDRGALKVVGEGMYSSNNAVRVTNPRIKWQSLESSNVNMAQEMTNAMASQRQLQNCSQALKMYDEVLDQALEISKFG